MDELKITFHCTYSVTSSSSSSSYSSAACEIFFLFAVNWKDFFFVFCLNIFSCLSFNDFRTKNSFTRLNLNWSTKNHRDGSENFTFTNGRQKMRPWRNKIRKKVTPEGHICERNYVNERKSWERKVNGKSFGPSYHVCGVNGNT